MFTKSLTFNPLFLILTIMNYAFLREINHYRIIFDFSINRISSNSKRYLCIKYFQKMIVSLVESINFAVSMGSEIDKGLYRDIVRQLEKINVELANLGQELMEFDYECQKAKYLAEKK